MLSANRLLLGTVHNQRRLIFLIFDPPRNPLSMLSNRLPFYLYGPPSLPLRVDVNYGRSLIKTCTCITNLWFGLAKLDEY